ncbi:hypothetical protein QAD02_013830 [Eretmocerus hayati]|uniref:Uncharacterized protein n=1 Tax=Eretmocerus hayati TaxID=131215 RepID=A0ACC2P4J9_9HYME|nr:hypothetical protein QAD02_013830 [Eretmocerus hayati]
MYLNEFDEFNDAAILYESGDEGEEFIINRLPKRYVRDFQNPFEWHRAHEFTHRYRFPKEVVIYYILPLIVNKLAYENNRGLPAPPETQLIISLCYYVTGDAQQEIGDLHGFSQATVCRIVHRVSVALAELLHDFVHFPTTRKEQLLNIQQIFNIAGFPWVAAIVDGVHVEIISPGKAIGEIFRNRKDYFSINVLVAVDARGKILYIDVRNPGSAHDSTCLDRSGLNVIFIQYLVEGNLLGDSGFANLSYLLTPFVNSSDDAERLLTKCLISTRTVVEQTFGRWKKKFHCLYGIILYYLDNTISIICATAVL